MKKAPAALLNKIFSLSPIAMCLLTLEEKEIAIANNAFFELVGYSQDQIENALLQDLIYKKDFLKVVRRIDCLAEDNYVYEELRILSRGKSCKDVEIVIRKISHNKKMYFLCTFHDISCFKESDRNLRNKIQEEHEKTVKTVKGIIRNRLFLEKIHVAPVFLREIRKCKETDTLVQKVVHLMCHSSGLQYASANILLIEGDFLQVKYSNTSQPLQRFHLQKQHKLAQVFRGEKKIFIEDTGEITVAIPSENENQGVLQIFLNEKERSLIEANKNLIQSHADLVECLAQYIGLLLYNMQSNSQINVQSHHGIKLLHKEIQAKMSTEQDFCIMQIHWRSFDNDLLEYLEHIESIHNILTKNILSFKPTGSTLFYVGQQDFFLLVSTKLISSESAEAEKIYRKLTQESYTIQNDNVSPKIAIAVRKVQIKKKPSPRAILISLLKCIKKAKENNNVFIWDGEVKPVRQRVKRKLQ
ncbi:PAS domain-containing protein [Candidatus Uabimicrobium sp. HlEnr_7]|uniref:PAS domain-containing protein n=1 Tax=Candidatus Uabimicrobium helgolandensis TaxID=3095367 RepID=UPI003557D17A